MTPRELLESADALFLDFDGPLAALMPPPANAEASQRARRSLRGLELPTDVAETTDHLAVLRYALEAHPERLAEVEAACTDAEVEAARTCQPGYHAQSLLDFARDRELLVAVISNNSDVAVREFIKRHSWEARVHAYACRTPDSIEMLKPSPGFLFLAADHLHIDVSTALLVGDSVSDVLAGKAAGVRVLGLAKNDARALSLVEAGADDVAPLRHGRLL